MLKLKNLLIATFALCCLFACKSKKDELKFNSYISAFTSGTISIESSIRITTSQNIDSEIFAKKAKDLFDFSPNIKGEAHLIDENNIEFIPSENLKRATEYSVKFNVKKLFKEASGDDKVFAFSFQTFEPSFSKSIDGVENYEDDDELYFVAGTITTSDVVDKEDAEKLLKVEAAVPYKLSWEHTGNNHYFRIDSLKSKKDFYAIKLLFNGKSIGYDYQSEDEVTIPSISDFSLLNVESVISGDSPYFICRFSKLINKKQDLSGLITMTHCSDLRFKIESNKILVYPSCSSVYGTQTVTIHRGILSAKGIKLAEDSENVIQLELPKPDIKIDYKGNILPNSNGLLVPFQAVSLRAVNVRVIKVYEKNVAQFLQVNMLNTRNQMKRAGRLIAMKTIELGDESDSELTNWATYSIDLTNLIKAEPGAIYRIILSFDQSQAIYPCEGEHQVDDEDFESQFEEEAAKFDYNGNGYYDEDGDYNFYYSENDYNEDGNYSYYNDYEDYEDYESARENPCEKAYYKTHSAVGINILASDIGVVAKVNSTGTVNVAVSNLVTAEPIGDATVEIFNYQQIKIGQNKTSSQGLAEVQLKGKPFLMIVSSNNQKAYLRLDDASALNVSSFDVSGAVVEKGLKGYIYGERGVWRPGDTLFLNFILNDPTGIIPKNHPVNFELVNPLGQSIAKRNVVGNEYDFYSFTVPTASDAPTGNWMVYARIGGTSFSKRIKIETIKPNRLKMTMTLDNYLKNGNGKISGTLTAKWLHGAPAKNLKADIVGKISRRTTTFEGYDNYIFDNYSIEVPTELNVYEGTLNAEGEATFSKSIGDNIPGTANIRFIMRVFEESGNFSINETSENIKLYKYYVGLKHPDGDGYYNKIETDKDITYSLAYVDAQGKPQSRKGIKVEIYKTNWNWWWSSYNGYSASYSQRKYNKLMTTRTVDAVNGRATFTHKAPRNEWGYYEIIATDPESGNQTKLNVYYGWPEWGDSPQIEDGGEKANELMVGADKKEYKVGEKAVVTFPSSDGAKALVSIESGSKTLNMFWTNCSAKETSVSFDVTADMVPNVYVNITHIQKHATTANDLPIRMYGIVPISVVDPETKLEPKIDMPATLQPEQTFSVKVSEANDKPMSYTLAIVDDGLLDITNFKTPNAWSTFFEREALGVRTFDIYNYVIGAYGGKIEQIFAIGGGDDGVNGGKNKVNRFKPVVMFLGPFVLKGGSNTHTITMPNYVGSVRAMVVAGNGKAFGASDKTVEVKKPLMVVATLPRVIGPGETVDLSADVFAMEKSIKNANVEVTASDIFEIQDTKTKTLQFATIGDELAVFKLKTKEKIGSGKVKIVARSGSESAQAEIEIEVRNANPKTYALQSKVISAGESWNGNYNLTGMEGTNKVGIEVSSFPSLNIDNRLSFLLGYPHGCIEQTTSKAFPQLYLSDVVDLTDAQKAFASENVKAGLNRLRSFVTSEGGFAYWPGERETNSWGSSYAGHFMIEAENKGYSVPAAMKSNWIKYQRKVANNWTYTQNRHYSYYAYSQDYFDQAYRLYTLALAKAPEMGAMNRLKEMKLSVQAKWMLAAAYALAGQMQTAKNLTANLATQISPYSGFSQSFGSSERDMAMIVETLLLLNEQEKAFLLAQKISTHLNSNEWMSTQTTAYCLATLSKFAAQYKSGGLEFSYQDGTNINVTAQKTVWKTNIKNIRKDGTFSISNRSQRPMFVNIQTEGIPTAGNEKSQANGLQIDVKYTNLNGTAINVGRLTQGTDFIAEVTVTNPGTNGYYTNLVLSQIFPSGWEIMNDRINADDGTADGGYSSYYTYKDIRDDRVYTYFDLSAAQKARFKVKLNAAYIGRFYLPAVACEAMYDAKISANTNGQWVEVVQ